MATIFDLIGSLVFSGALFLIIVTANDTALEVQSTSHGDMLVQQMLVNVAQMVEGEFRNMGFGVPENSQTVLLADTASITFMSDLDRAGTSMDTIRYSTGPVSELSATQNEQDRYLYRRVNSGTKQAIGVVTVFGLRYFTRAGDTLDMPVAADQLSEIHVVEVTMEVQNSYAPYRPTWSVRTGERNALYSSSLWQQTRLASQNTRR
jgi:hypothetical protein